MGVIRTIPRPFANYCQKNKEWYLAMQCMAHGQYLTMQEVIKEERLQKVTDDSAVVDFSREVVKKVLEKYKVTEDWLREISRVVMNQIHTNPGFDIPLLVTLDAFRYGLKVFSIEKSTLVPLGMMRPNVSFEELHMPFESIVIELPPNSMEMHYAGGTMALPVVFAIVTQTSDRIEIVTYGDSKDRMVLNCARICTRNEDGSYAMIEDEIERFVQKAFQEDKSFFTEYMVQKVRSTVQVIFNYLLLLGEVGIARKERISDKEKMLIKTNRQKELQEYQIEKPCYYELKQIVRLYEKKTETEKEEGTNTNRHVKPHWRRGHYRMQKVGPQRMETKRVKILPVLVNAHMFAGDPTDIEVLYK